MTRYIFFKKAVVHTTLFCTSVSNYIAPDLPVDYFVNSTFILLMTVMFIVNIECSDINSIKDICSID